MRGGQVTMFFIIGLVLLFTFGIFYLLSGDEPTPAAQVGNEALNSYVRTCVDSIVERELRTLGESGGIWPVENSQYEYVTVGGEQVLVGVTQNRLQPGEDGILPLAYADNRYPDTGVRIQDAGVIMTENGPAPMYEFQDGYFGDTMFPALCRSCRHKMGIEMGGVTGTRGIEVSVEERFEQKVNESLSDCINRGTLNQYLGTDVEPGEPTVALNFTNQAILLNIRYPMSINGQEQELALSQRYSIRYQALMSFVQDIAREETRDVLFTLNDPQEYMLIPSYRDGFEVERTNRLTVQGYDIFTMKDERSILSGDPYFVQFAVQHRPPMLDPITRMEECVDAAGADPDDQTVTVRSDDPSGICRAVSVDGEDWQELGPLPDLTIQLKNLGSDMVLHFDICNEGEAPAVFYGDKPSYGLAATERIDFKPFHCMSGVETEQVTLEPGECILSGQSRMCSGVYAHRFGFSGTGEVIATVDPHNLIPENDESNNEDRKSFPIDE